MSGATVVEVAMPRLSDSMEEGTILAWRKQVGDSVEVGEELAEIETDKANMAYEADAAGTVLEIRVPEGGVAAVGEVIALIGDPDAGGSVVPPPPPAADDVAAGASEGSDRVKASPVAKRLAREKGVDLSSIEGTGPGGRIVKKDVKKAASEGDTALPPSTQQEEGGGPASPAAAPTGAPAAAATPTPPAPSATPDAETAKGTVTTEELSRLQQVVARRMAESKATAPHFYLEAEIDMSRAVAARASLKAAASEGEVIPSFNDMVIKACALALVEFPRANGAYKDGRFELYSRVNVGLAVAAEDALVVPTVFDADRKGLRQIATESRALAAKVREGSITPPELSGATFTVSNLGMFGIDSFSAVINSPQAAILAVGAIVERPAVREGQIVPAHLMNLTLSCDHRILYGADGARFLARVRALLEEPLALAL